jgi:hypothetical protein
MWLFNLIWMSSTLDGFGLSKQWNNVALIQVSVFLISALLGNSQFYCHWVNHVIGWRSHISWKESVLLSLGKSRDWLAHFKRRDKKMPTSVQIRSVTLQKETARSCETLVPLPKFHNQNWGISFLTCINLVFYFNRILQPEGTEPYTLILTNKLGVSA